MLLLTSNGSPLVLFFFFQAEDGIRDYKVTGVQTCALPILPALRSARQDELELVLPREAQRRGDVAPSVRHGDERLVAAQHGEERREIRGRGGERLHLRAGVLRLAPPVFERVVEHPAQPLGHARARAAADRKSVV